MLAICVCGLAAVGLCALLPAAYGIIQAAAYMLSPISYAAYLAFFTDVKVWATSFFCACHYDWGFLFFTHVGTFWACLFYRVAIWCDLSTPLNCFPAPLLPMVKSMLSRLSLLFLHVWHSVPIRPQPTTKDFQQIFLPVRRHISS